MIRGRELAAWLRPDTSQLRQDLIRRAMCDIGICETPPGSNRSGRIDEYLRASGLAESEIVAGRGYWCAAAMGAWCREVGAWVADRCYSCDEWLVQARRQGRVRSVGVNPAMGDLILYGAGNDAVHCGVVIRTVWYPASRLILSVEGNTSVGGSTVSRNGIAVAMKSVDENRVLCYVNPEG